jgi:carboxyl-terminal processing protease
MKNHKSLIFVLIGLVSGFMLSIASHVFAVNGETPSSIPLEELRAFSNIFQRIKEDYVDEVSDKDLLQSAIKGMLSGLDPHSSYLDKDAFKELEIGTSGQFGGLGIQVSMEDGFVKVVSPIDDTPAFKAGVLAGDLIIRLDSKPVKGMTLSDAVKIMRGKPGEAIALTIIREGAEKPLKIKVVRDIIKVTSIRKRILEPGFGYLRISQFQTATTKDLHKAAKQLVEENKGPLKGLVLDLRNNPGGVLSGAVGVSDAFLEKGLIVYTQGRNSTSNRRFNATPGDVINAAPLIVLVNGGSASASEIVAGALKDHKRAIIVGTKTFGKGSVQTIQRLPYGAGAVKLTTARYYTPSGTSIQAKGITPDIISKHLSINKAKKSEFEPIKEASLNKHLENNQGDKKKVEKERKVEVKVEKEKEKEDLAAKDSQLYEALNLLKALSIYKDNQAS